MSILTEQDDTLAMLRDSLARYLEDNHGFEQRLHTLRHADDAPPPFWQGLARELGLLGAALPEAQGGLGVRHGRAPGADGNAGRRARGRALPVDDGDRRGPAAAPPRRAGRCAAGARRGGARPCWPSRTPSRRAGTTRADVQAQLVREGDGFRARRPQGGGAGRAVGQPPGRERRAAPPGLSLLVVPRDTPGVRLRAYPTRDGGRAADIAFDSARLPADALLGAEGGALPQIEQRARRGHAGHLRRGGRRHAPPAARHARLRAPAQAVRRADRELPGAAAPPGRHAHGTGAGRRAHRERGGGRRCRSARRARPRGLVRQGGRRPRRARPWGRARCSCMAAWA
jgi:hypothetical protein